MVFEQGLSQGGTTLDAGMMLVCRPEYDPPRGPTYANYLPAIPTCDTNNIPDCVRILRMALNRGNQHVVRLIGDGQTVLNMKNLKRRRPAMHAGIWIDPADMHAFAHSTYAGHYLFWDAIGQACKKRLQRKRVEPHPKDLDDDKFDIHKVFVLVMYISIMVYFHEILGLEAMRSAAGLHRRVQHNAGLKVLYYFALLHGGPICLWWRGFRSNDGAIMDGMWQWYYHLHRAAHKTNYSNVYEIK